ncbi:hypothetical protein CSKR_108580 [Clonorchis sinensis]|uniref:Uncharacterized protein n=1 Tax=Clonorchis sinensis TaxID=79923 RepID=A0A3R7GV58_CLOSI|nr:hypothetical protein CSKR_108580 [Clonorchis sinensis]
MCALSSTTDHVYFLVGRSVFMNAQTTQDLKAIWTSIHNFPPVNCFISTVWYDSDPRTNEAVDMTEFEWREDPFAPEEPVALAHVAKKMLIASSLAQTANRRVLCEYFLKSETSIFRAKFKDCSVDEQAFVKRFDSISNACFHERQAATSIDCVNSCNTLSVPNCHAARRKHEGWDTARLSKPRQGNSRGRDVRATLIAAQFITLKLQVNVFLSCTFMFTCLRDTGPVQDAGFVSKRSYEAHQCQMKVHQSRCGSCGSWFPL